MAITKWSTSPPPPSVACCAHQVQNFDLSQSFGARAAGPWLRQANLLSPRQKWSNMSNLGRSRRRRWRGVALGGHLQRGCRFCLASHNGQATAGQSAEWCRPEIVYAGGKPTAIQIAKHARALRSIGARKVRREGRQWVWRLGDSSAG